MDFWTWTLNRMRWNYIDNLTICQPCRCLFGIFTIDMNSNAVDHKVVGGGTWCRTMFGFMILYGGQEIVSNMHCFVFCRDNNTQQTLILLILGTCP